MSEQRYCKRLIEVDLPIKQISEHARREKSIRHGHISTLHIWWARRPLAACRAVLCAALWPDPVDPLCPKEFYQEAARILKEFRDKRGGKPRNWDNLLEIREALLAFIAEFSSWDNAKNGDFLKLSKHLTEVSHQCFGGSVGTKPLVLDPFAGGGSIPLEALRVGADIFASDLNSIPVLLNKITIEYLPKYKNKLSEEFQKWGEIIQTELEKELSGLYPVDADKAVPIAYLWARTIRCEGPNCGAEVPLIRSLVLAKRDKNYVALRILPNQKKKRIDFEVVNGIKDPDIGEGTVKRGSATCPCCGYTTPVSSVRKQLLEKKGGVRGARLFCVVTTYPNKQGRFYRTPTEIDIKAIVKAEEIFDEFKTSKEGKQLIPNEELPLMSGVFNVPLYGHDTWGSLFSPRQLLALTTLVKIVTGLSEKLAKEYDAEFARAIKCCLALAVSRHADINASLGMWHTTRELITHVFGRQALGMVWDFAEACTIGDASGAFKGGVHWIANVLANNFDSTSGHVEQADATHLPLPDDSVKCIFTDPPYYNAVPYADLSDFFYVWLRRMLSRDFPDLFSSELSPKACEICEMSNWDPRRYSEKNKEWFELKMKEAMAEGRRVLSPDGIGIVVFAHKSTEGWEAQLKAMLDAGWVFTGSWPIDTEMETRLRARGSAALSSSIHLVCRPREHSDGSLIDNCVGDWRDILQALPTRIHEWMPRLAKEGVVGADAIFACLGPALEIFSKYSHVEKANGEQVELKEYLEQVWAAVAKEALNMIFKGAHTEGFEEDSRLTAMWLWTLSTAENGSGGSLAGEENENQENEESYSSPKISGFTLEYDAARKIAQGLGVHLEELGSVIRLEGGKATLLPVSERIQYLFGKGSTTASSVKRKKKENQITLFEEFNKVEEQGWSLGDEKSSIGKTILDRLHQAMILFGAGRADAMRRFLVEEGVGKDERFWRLAQAFSALYPSNTDEKRWVDGVLARKKSLGF